MGRAARQTEDKAQQLRYWQAFNDYLEAHNPDLRPKTSARPRDWAGYSTGGPILSAAINTTRGRIRACLRMRGESPKADFAALREHKDDIERTVGKALSWEELRTSARIALYEDVDPTDEADWPNQHAWLADALVRLDRALGPHVRTLQDGEAAESVEPSGPELPRAS